MRFGSRVSAIVLVLGLAGCSTPAMSRTDARDFARRAFEAAGVEGVRIEQPVEATRCGDPPQPGWMTHATAPAGTYELCVARTGDRALFVRDVGPDGTGPALTDEQFERLETFRFDPVGERVDEWALPAALLLAAVAGALALRLRKDSRVRRPA